MPDPAAAALLLAPLHELSRRVAAGELTAAALTDACLTHIERSNPKLHAFVEVYTDEARATAEAADIVRTRGLPVGPLHGIPLALKDLCELEGRRTTGGSLHWAGRVSALTCTVARRLMDAGMIVVGKTHMVEFAFGGWGTNERMGTPWNPWDLATHRVPGGSSSGSGVAVAAGMVPAALGSDTGGSVRIPASVCGLVGLKTTVGRVSNHGILPLSPTLDTIGPLVRAVEDAALLHDVLQGPDGADPATWPHAPAPAMPRLREPVRGLRVGLPGNPHLDDLHPAVALHFETAVQTLARLGVQVETIPLPGSFFSYLEQTGAIISAEAYDLLAEVVEDEAAPLDPHVRARILGGKARGTRAYLSSRREQRQAQAALAPVFDQVDAILTPTTPLPAPPLSDVDESRLPLSRFTRAINFLGLCALAVPMGITEGQGQDVGLPTSLQIIGRPFSEPLLLRLGWAYEQARGPLARQPDLAAMA